MIAIGVNVTLKKIPRIVECPIHAIGVVYGTMDVDLKPEIVTKFDASIYKLSFNMSFSLKC